MKAGMIIISVLLLLGCTAQPSVNPAQPNVTQPANSSPPAQTAPSHTGKTCWTENGKLFCKGMNYSMQGAQGLPVPESGLDMPECQRVKLIDAGYNQYGVERVGDGLVGVAINAPSNASPVIGNVADFSPESMLADPCKMKVAMAGGTIGSGYCIYNSSDGEISCGEPKMLVYHGVSVNGTSVSAAALNITAPGALFGVWHGTNVSFATLCNLNYSQLFELNDNGSARALTLKMETSAFGSDSFCYDPAKFLSKLGG